MGILAERNGDLAEAKSYFNKISSGSYAYTAQIHKVNCMIRSEAPDELINAEKIIADISKGNPQMEADRLALTAWICLKKNENDSALYYVDKCFTVDSTNGRALYIKACLEASINNENGIKTYIERAIKQNIDKEEFKNEIRFKSYIKKDWFRNLIEK
jgi:hypothetical protein